MSHDVTVLGDSLRFGAAIVTRLPFNIAETFFQEAVTWY